MTGSPSRPADVATPGTADPARDLVILEDRLGHRFDRPDLLDRALTHGSLGGGLESYERLEFLGDRVLNLLVAHMLYDRFPREPEGSLARRHTALVRGETLAHVARTLGLASLIRLSQGEVDLGGRDNPTLLADVCEAVLGALYLDGGLAVVDRVVRRHWTPLMDQDLSPPKDPKTSVQEWAQGRGLPLPVYETVAASGPDHAPTFTVAVRVKGRPEVRADGASKRQAEQRAAALLLKGLRL
ncbi:ribonuclease III [Roseospira visakhapatnamensis]|uniref:Ribonuclease 3 n=1 Tax=Roseospira visakhapatnamensis TaxID=390880 RepID=A0A7W6W8E3_9PROT|nr:ribonuclease III [Roseospira visakhapatnamensis]MBB4264920.1 ribonuclease-3 [Roseospira visakhapatnamensis]